MSSSWTVFKKDAKRKRYTIRGRDHHAVRRQLPAFNDRSLSREFARNIAKLVEHRQCDAPLPPMLSVWLKALPDRIRYSLNDWGLIDDCNRPMAEHVGDYEAVLCARGNTHKHVRQTVGHVRRLIEGCGFTYWADIKGSDVQRYLGELMSAKDMHASAQTQNYYLRDFKGFIRWAVNDRRLNESPIEHLRPLSAARVREDRRHQRRALAVDEVTKLLAAATDGPTRGGMTGKTRAMLYRLAIETGLRASELATLRAESFCFSDEPYLKVDAAYTKNRHQVQMPLRYSTAKQLEAMLTSLPPDQVLFAVSDDHKRINMLKADLKAAGIPYKLNEKRGEVADFHALRHTCGTWLASQGVHPKVAQMIMRHGTITLTMDLYTHTDKSEASNAINRLPNLDVGASNDPDDVTPAN